MKFGCAGTCRRSIFSSTTEAGRPCAAPFESLARRRPTFPLSRPSAFPLHSICLRTGGWFVAPVVVVDEAGGALVRDRALRLGAARRARRIARLRELHLRRRIGAALETTRERRSRRQRQERGADRETCFH